jgi:hypothetical protein
MLAQLINSGRLKRGADGSYSISDAPDSNTMYGGAEQGQLFGNGLVGQAISNPIVNGVKGVTTLPGERTDYTPEEVLEYKNFIGTHGGFERLPSSLKSKIWDTMTPDELQYVRYAQAQKEKDNPGIGGGIASLFTGGLSDVVQGNMAGTAINELGPWASVINPISAALTAHTGGLFDIGMGLDKAGKTDGSFLDKFGAFADRSMDPMGAVDTVTRYIGDGIYAVVPSVSPYLEKAGTLIGGVIGSAYLPGIGTAGGAAAGSGIGNKLGSGHREYDYFGDLFNAVKSGASAYAGYALGGIPGMLAKGVINTGGNLLYPYINPDGKYVKNTDPNKLSLLQDQLISSGGDLLGTTGAMIGGLLSSPKQNPDLAPITQQQGLVPIDWEAELKKLSMPLEIKRKKEEEDTYMNYKFKPKDYLVNYL